MNPVIQDAESAEGIRFFIGKVMDYRIAKVLLVATDLGIFTTLAAAPLELESVCARLKTEPRATRILLDALVAVRLLTLSHGRYANSKVADRFLVEGRPDYKGNNLKYQERIWDFWSRLGDVVRTGIPPRTLGDLLSGETPAFQDAYIRGMRDIAGPPAAAVAGLLELRPGMRVLDIGGGPGTYALALLEAHPEVHVDLFDLPSTLEVTRTLIAGHPCASRVSLIAGDYLANDLPAGYDLALLSHVTHDESPAVNKQLLARAGRSVVPGGRVAVHDFIVDESRTQPAFSALFAVNMLVYTTGGQTYSAGEYESWLLEAGLKNIRTFGVLEGLVDNPSALILAERPLT